MPNHASVVQDAVLQMKCQSELCSRTQNVTPHSA